MQKYKVFEIIVFMIITLGIVLPGLSDLVPPSRFPEWMDGRTEQEGNGVETFTLLGGGLQADTSDYLLGPGDFVSINVEFLPEISKTYVISDTGSITFPTLLPALKVQSLTVEQLQSLLLKVLTEYMYEPRITVSISEYHSHRILLLGPFQNPGNYILRKERSPLLDILTEAGGLREIKEGDELIILRALPSSNPENGNKVSPDMMQSIRVNLQKLLRDGDLTQNVMIQADDVIYVSSFFVAEQYVYVSGGGRRGAGAIPYEKGLTAFKALMRAGVTPDDPQMLDLIIIRGESEGGKFITTQLKFDPKSPGMGDVVLKPEDIVILPSVNSQVIYVAGEVNKPGALPYKEGLTVLQAVLDAGGMGKKAVGTKAKVLREDLQGRTQIPLDMDLILEKGDKTQNIALMPGDIIVIPSMTLKEDILITGKVNTPGLVPYEEDITLIKAIFLAGGLDNNMIKSEIRIMKKNGEVQPAFSFDVIKTQSVETSKYNPSLEPGDLVVVLGASPGNIVSVLGKVQRPGVIDYEEGLTVLQAILQSGGFSQGAARSKVGIMRGEKDKQQKIRVDLENLTDKNNRSRETILLPGDMVIVPETIF
jgi:polysaccharide export outer membrane protein